MCLENGQVREWGSHSQLLSRPGSKYAELWNSQHRYGFEPIKRKSERDELLEELERAACCGQSKLRSFSITNNPI